MRAAGARLCLTGNGDSEQEWANGGFWFRWG